MHVHACGVSTTLLLCAATPAGVQRGYGGVVGSAATCMHAQHHGVRPRAPRGRVMGRRAARGVWRERRPGVCSMHACVRAAARRRSYLEGARRGRRDRQRWRRGRGAGHGRCPRQPVEPELFVATTLHGAEGVANAQAPSRAGTVTKAVCADAALNLVARDTPSKGCTCTCRGPGRRSSHRRGTFVTALARSSQSASASGCARLRLCTAGDCARRACACQRTTVSATVPRCCCSAAARDCFERARACPQTGGRRFWVPRVWQPRARAAGSVPLDCRALQSSPHGRGPGQDQARRTSRRCVPPPLCCALRPPCPDRPLCAAACSRCVGCGVGHRLIGLLVMSPCPPSCSKGGIFFGRLATKKFFFATRTAPTEPGDG